MLAFNGVSSNFGVVKHGVPQGSILVPLLFIIYIKDICNFLLPSNCVLFADDTTLIYSDNNFNDLIDISKSYDKRAQEWFSSNRLMLNEDKAQKLFFSSNNKFVNGDNVNLLGIVIDDRLNWSSHVDKLRHKLCNITF